MSFDLGQLISGPLRDVVLGQVTKSLGVSNDNAGSLLNKGFIAFKTIEMKNIAFQALRLMANNE